MNKTRGARGSHNERGLPMKKNILPAAAAALLAGMSAGAANPFTDVEPGSWAYQAAADLADAGVVAGYPDGTFRGDRPVTRYEMAQITARLMAREDRLTAEQRAVVDKLAAEYADELDSLGVRVTNLEKKIGNISFGGDARMRYQSGDNMGSESWNGRIHVMLAGQVNDRTTVNARLSTDNVSFKGDDDADIGFESMNVRHQLGRAAVTLGRYDLFIGNQAGWFYGSGWGFDGAQAEYRFNDRFSVKTGFGQFNYGSSRRNADGTADLSGSLKNKDVYYAQARYGFGGPVLTASYLSFQDAIDDFGGTPYRPEIWDADLLIPLGDFRVFGEYMKNTTAPDGYDTAWNAGAGYGAMNLKRPGTWTLDLIYNDVDCNTYFGGTGYQTDILEPLTTSIAQDRRQKNITYWMAKARVVVAENTFVHGQYVFGTDGTTNGGPKDTWTLSLNYVF